MNTTDTIDNDEAASIFRRFKAQLDDSTQRAAIAKFIEEVSRDPGHAMRWSSGALAAAAVIDVKKAASRIVRSIEESGKPAQEQVTILQRAIVSETISKAMSGRGSNNPSANDMDDCVTKAWADLADWLLGA